MFVIDSATSLRILRREDAAELFALTDANRQHLRKWLPWPDAVTEEGDTLAYIDTVTAQREAGGGPVFAILRDGAIAGIAGFYAVQRAHRSGGIGYWLAAAAQGRGVMTECCRFLVGYGFRTLDLYRIEIAAAVENRRSRAIPERLDFTLEGILRGRECIDGIHLDHAMYSMLRHELAP